jgi:SAM-dependent methyltransferase
VKLYDELAEWWPIFSAPAEYEEEAGVYADAFALHTRRDITHMLELGSGGGNNASHIKERFDMTLCDLSPGMLEVSRKLNPECEHVQGDMRTVRLGRTFDAVLIHDAIMYMTTEADLASAIRTAADHLEPGGMALFVPDDVSETYVIECDHGGHDGPDGRSIRYLQWTHDVVGTVSQTTFVYVIRDGDDETIETERHTWGLFPRATWIRLIEAAGLEPVVLPYPHSDFDREHEMFAGHKPA